tara:strand:- start:17170 stop:17475 length:306 start_codon:yes stop_codon:yes gene_type:complete
MLTKTELENFKMKNKVIPDYEYLNSNTEIELDADQIMHLIEYGIAGWNLEVKVPNKKKLVLVSVNIRYKNWTLDKKSHWKTKLTNWKEFRKWFLRKDKEIK